MQMTDYDYFEKYWEKFVTQLRGQMMTQAKKGIFSFASLNLILADCVGFWDSRYSEGGRWLDRYEKEHPDKAELIRDILLKDMKFQEEESGSLKKDFLKYVVPAGSAVAGLAIARVAGATTATQAICTLAPAAVAYPVTNNVVHTLNDNVKKKVIQSYMDQLNKYKKGVEGILKEE